MLKAIFFLEILTFLSCLFGYVGKLLDKKAKVSFKIYDIRELITDNYNRNIAQHIMK